LPDKLLHDTDQREYHLSPQLKPYVSGIEDEFIIFAAYFVPVAVCMFRSLCTRIGHFHEPWPPPMSRGALGYARYRKNQRAGELRSKGQCLGRTGVG
jgi:hypothetical protein